MAVIIFLSLTRNEYDTAMVDTSATLIIFAGCLVFHFWQHQPQRHALIAVAAFLIGVAAGIKYQALQVLSPVSDRLADADPFVSRLAHRHGQPVAAMRFLVRKELFVDRRPLQSSRWQVVRP
ncbi:hypothetical protein ACN9MZ_05310 [Pseudoduganella sp. S-14]|jgi:hypothetical protein|uniref:hypothetical protein n=1 Tax=Pseudoduganella sp. S-14 TaxID=3404065 RepID=UPI003CF6134D